MARKDEYMWRKKLRLTGYRRPFALKKPIIDIKPINATNTIGSTVIAPGQMARERVVSLKHFAIRSEVCGKRVVLIDDSIVRGATSRRLVSLLKSAGAQEVHIRICSPPVRFPCYFGIDTPHRKDLISNASNSGDCGFCLGCFTGEYPIPVSYKHS